MEIDPAVRGETNCARKYYRRRPIHLAGCKGVCKDGVPCFGRVPRLWNTAPRSRSGNQ
jgi:hypothetical protein